MIVTLTFIVLQSPRDTITIRMACCHFYAFAETLGEICTMHTGSFDSGRQTRAAQASLLGNEKLLCDEITDN